jgi:ribulose-5-phosphate 4-epimerase/fuculose-1-phosphate aldolase
MPQPETPLDAAIADLVVANRILAAEGVLDGFGHVSIRDPRDPACYLMSRSLAPALVTAVDIVQHDLDNKPTRDQGQTLYYERWIHGEIYKARREVNAIVHSHSPTVVPFASTKAPLRPILHNASFLGFGTPVFEIRNFIPNSDLMISTAALGKALADALGPTADVVLLRGHGNVVVGPTIQIAVLHRDQRAAAAQRDDPGARRRRLHERGRVRDHRQGHAGRRGQAVGFVEAPRATRDAPGRGGRFGCRSASRKLTRAHVAARPRPGRRASHSFSPRAGRRSG